MRMSAIAALSALTALAPTAKAQDGTIVYRLGKDTVAVETFTRSASRITGEMVGRGGATIIRTWYDMTVERGRPRIVVVKRMQADGTPLPNQPTEYRFAFRADSAIRETIWKDSTQRRAAPIGNAFPSLPVFIHAPMELIAAMPKGQRDSIPAISLAGSNIGYVGLETLGGDTLRMRGGFYAWVMRFDKGQLQSVDGMLTTNKSMGLRVPGKVDIAALAAGMKPAGTLSPRQVAGTTINQAPIFISYGSPAVRGRTVWGGQLVPLDSIWRTGANEATHLATGKTLVLGDLTLAPGLYTLWTQHTATGTWLIVNKQVGQWGTQYNPANDVGKVQMELKDAPNFLEDFTVTVRSTGQGRGAIDLGWGDKVATANFQVRNN